MSGENEQRALQEPLLQPQGDSSMYSADSSLRTEAPEAPSLVRPGVAGSMTRNQNPSDPANRNTDLQMGELRDTSSTDSIWSMCCFCCTPHTPQHHPTNAGGSGGSRGGHHRRGGHTDHNRRYQLKLHHELQQQQRRLLQQQLLHQQQREPAALIPKDLSTIDFNSSQGKQLAELAGGVWVSQLLGQLWPQISAAAEKTVNDMFPHLVDASKPAWMEGVTLDRFSLGPKPPVVQRVYVDEPDDYSSMGSPDASSTSNGDAKTAGQQPGCVHLRLDVAWDSQADMQLTVKPLPTKFKQYTPSLLQGVLSYMTSVTAGVQGLKLKANVLLTLAPLVPMLPVARAAQVSLLSSPQVDFNFTLTRGESHILNVLKPWLRTTIATAFAPFVIPERVWIPLDNLPAPAPSAGPMPMPQPLPHMQLLQGALVVRVVRAQDVPRMDYWAGHSDTYVDVWVRHRVKRRTPTIKANANPEWAQDQATFVLLVNTLRYQSLNLEMWDEDNALLDSADDCIGGAAVKLADMQPGQEVRLALKVVNDAVVESGVSRRAVSVFPGAPPPLFDSAASMGPQASSSSNVAAGPRMGSIVEMDGGSMTGHSGSTEGLAAVGSIAEEASASSLASDNPSMQGSAANNVLASVGSASSQAGPAAAAVAAKPSVVVPAFEDVPQVGAIDPAVMGGTSKVDVSSTRLHVNVRWLPASMLAAPQRLPADLGATLILQLSCAGVLHMVLSKVIVPDLSVLPLQLRPYITGQPAAAFPPLSPPITAPVRDPMTGEDLRGRRDIAFAWDAVWDVLGAPHEVARGLWVCELVSGAGTRNEKVVERIDMPLPKIMARPVPTSGGRLCGGNYTLRSESGYVVELQLLWSPLVPEGDGTRAAAATTAEEPAGITPDSHEDAQHLLPGAQKGVPSATATTVVTATDGQPSSSAAAMMSAATVAQNAVSEIAAKYGAPGIASSAGNIITAAVAAVTGGAGSNAASGQQQH